MDTHFDVLVLGTGLTQSIAAAALAKAGFKVVHVDQNSYYGADEASLSHDELLQLSHSPSSRRSNFFSSSENPLPFSRTYSLSLAPALIPSSGALINSLILSGVSRYAQFKLLDAVFIYRHGAMERVPGNKEDIFKARNVSLVDKRKLMRFIQFATGNFEERAEIVGQEDTPFGEFMRDKFSLSEKAREAIHYGLAYGSSLSDSALPALRRLRRFLRSAGRYGNSPFLIGHYGGLGELAQGFCRTCAVKGGVYILGRKVISLNLPSEASPSETTRASICLEEVPDVLTADMIIASQDYLPGSSLPKADTEEPVYVCGIVITERPIVFPSSEHASVHTPSRAAAANDAEGIASDQSQLDTAVVMFSPGSLPEGKAPNVVRILQMGEGTLSCPNGKYILYLWTQMEKFSGSAEELLTPYMSAVTLSSSEADLQAGCVDFSCFYIRHQDPKISPPTNSRTLIVPPLSSVWTEIADQSAEDAERLFWDTIKALERGENGGTETFWPLADTLDDNSGDEW